MLGQSNSQTLLMLQTQTSMTKLQTDIIKQLVNAVSQSFYKCAETLERERERERRGGGGVEIQTGTETCRHRERLKIKTTEIDIQK